MTTTTAAPKARAKRTSVPAPEPAAPSSALDALTSSPHPAGAVLVDVDVLRPHPGNPRRDLGDLVELTDSIRAHGVRQNLLVVPDPDEPAAYRLVIGHRRTAAAHLAGVTHLPAVIDASLTAAEQLELMLLENLQRADLTAIEEADAYQGLLDLGLDTAAIAKTTGRSRATVAARLRLRGLPAAAQEKVHTHQVTLDDAARLLDFTDHPEVLAALTEQLGERDFIHQVQRSANEISRAKAIAALREQLVTDGVRVVEPGEYSRPPLGAAGLSNLTNDGKASYGNGAQIKVEKHASCPGHVAWIRDVEPVEATYGCAGWKKHGHFDRYAYGDSAGSAPSGPMSDEQKAERRELIANNKAAAAAETVRREWLAAYLRLHHKLPPDAPTYAAVVIRPGASADFHEKAILDSLLYGKDVTDRDVAADLAKPDLAMRYLVAIAAARVEAQMPKDFWRKGDHRRELFAHHLSHLAGWGYPLSDVEQLVVDTVKASGR